MISFDLVVWILWILGKSRFLVTQTIGDLNHCKPYFSLGERFVQLHVKYPVVVKYLFKVDLVFNEQDVLSRRCKHIHIYWHSAIGIFARRSVEA